MNDKQNELITTYAHLMDLVHQRAYVCHQMNALSTLTAMHFEKIKDRMVEAYVRDVGNEVWDDIDALDDLTDLYLNTRNPVYAHDDRSVLLLRWRENVSNALWKFTVKPLVEDLIECFRVSMEEKRAEQVRQQLQHFGTSRITAPLFAQGGVA